MGRMSHDQDVLRPGQQHLLKPQILLQAQIRMTALADDSTEMLQHSMIAAAARGDQRTLKHLRSASPPCPWVSDVCTAAAGHGHLDVLKWARKQGCPIDEEATRAAQVNR